MKSATSGKLSIALAAFALFVAFAAWPGVLATIDDRFPALPVVGYEHGDDLTAAVRHGFEPIGALRIWLHGN